MSFILPDNRRLSPTLRSEPFHEFLHSISTINTRILKLRKLLINKKKRAIETENRCKNIFKLFQNGDLLVKRKKVVVNNYTFYPIEFTSKDDPKGYFAKGKDLDYLSYIFLNQKNIEEIEYEKNELFSFYLIKVIALFENYLNKIFYITFYKYKSLFHSEKEYQTVLKYDFEKQMKWLKLKGYGFTYIISRIQRGIEFISTRNILLHNNGIVNYMYLNKIKNSKRKNGEQISIDYGYTNQAIDFFTLLARSIDDIIAKKALKIPYEMFKNSEEKKKIKAYMKFLKQRTSL